MSKKTDNLEDTSIWYGYYYSDYEIILTATPAKGYNFMGWENFEGVVTSKEEGTEIRIKMGEDGKVWKPVFVKE